MGPKRREWGREREQSTPAPDRPERTEASTSRAPSSSLQSWERPQKDSPSSRKRSPLGWMVWYRFTGVPCSRAAMRQLICFQLSPGWYSRQPRSTVLSSIHP